MYDLLFGKIYPWISDLALLAFMCDLIIMIPLYFIRKTKILSASTICYSSYIFGLQLWLSCLMLTLQIGGIVAVVIGLLFLGIGVVPFAIIATLFYGMWKELGELLLSLLLVFGCRMLGTYMLEKAELQF
jgi:hypothetical protein